MTTARTVLITGVSAGLGHALAKEYLERGWTVFGCSRTTPDELLRHDAFHFESLDLSCHEGIAPALSRLLESASQLHLVILNAGALGAIRDLTETPLAEARDLVNINLWANKTLLDALLTSELRVHQVVAMSSGAAVNGNRGWGAYAISKAALNMLTKLYAAETPDTHFCALAPGIIDTAMQEELCSGERDPRFPSLDSLRAKRHTDEMPTPEVAAARLVHAMEQLPRLVESGAFTDVRSIGQ